MPPRLGALRDDHLHAGLKLANRMGRLAAQRPQQDVALPQFRDDIVRRRAQRADQQLHLRMTQDHLNQMPGTVRRHRATALDDVFVNPRALIRRQIGNPLGFQQPVHEGAMSVWNQQRRVAG